MNQAKELKLTPKMFIGGAAGFTMPEFQKNSGVASDKVISATLWHQVLKYPGAMDYFNKFKAKYNAATEYHGAEAYAAAYVIADVLKRAKSYKNDDIKDALAATGHDDRVRAGKIHFLRRDEESKQGAHLRCAVD